MSIFSFVFLFFLTIFAAAAVYTVISYTFESISIMAMCKRSGYRRAFTAWIPFYHKYLLGKIAGKRVLGAIAGILMLISVCLGVYCYVHRELELIPFIMLVLSLLAVFILDTMIAHRVYVRCAGRYGDVLTILSVLSLGLLRPLFLFVLRNQCGHVPASQTSGTDI